MDASQTRRIRSGSLKPRHVYPNTSAPEMSKLYPVQEIGSLAKPRWRTKGLTQPLSSKDLVEAEEWAQRLGIPDFQDRAKQLLAAQEQNDRIRELLELSTIYGLRLFEQTGLDNVG